MSAVDRPLAGGLSEITELAAKLGLEAEKLEPYGRVSRGCRARWKRPIHLRPALARRIYGGAGVELSEAARDTLERLPAELHRVPVFVAKTHPLPLARPTAGRCSSRFILPVRELRAYTGAGWLVAVCGETQTMPGLPPHSAAERMDLDAESRIVGLA